MGFFYPLPSSNQKNKIINGAVTIILYIIHIIHNIQQRYTYGILYRRIVYCVLRILCAQQCNELKKRKSAIKNAIKKIKTEKIKPKKKIQCVTRAGYILHFHLLPNNNCMAMILCVFVPHNQFILPRSSIILCIGNWYMFICDDGPEQKPRVRYQRLYIAQVPVYAHSY